MRLTALAETHVFGQVSELRTLIQDDDLGGDEDDDGNGQHVVYQGNREGNPEMMIFEGSNEVQPAYVPPPPKDSKEVGVTGFLL